MSRLTPRQREALAVLADGGEYTPSRLAATLGTSKEGAGQTASSLVRKGHAQRLHTPARRVSFKITAQGLAQAEHTQTALW